MRVLDRINEMRLDFNLLMKVISAGTFKKRTPLFVNLLVTNRCNMKCVYCIVKCNKLPVLDMPLGDLFRIVDELHALGTRYISIQGGEPLLRDDIGEIIDYINHNGIITDLVTNGLLIKEKLEELRKVRRLCVSLDGREEYNDLNRGRGTYRRVMENLEYARENGLNIYRIEATFTRNNADLDNLRFLFALAERFGCMLTPFPGLITEYNISDEFRAVALQKRSELIEFWRKVALLKKEGHVIHYADDIINNVVNMPETVCERYDETTTKKLGLPFCTLGRMSCYIDTDGEMYPCVPLFGLKGRNVYKNGVEKCWESFDDLSCRYCFIGGFCSFARINIKTVAHLWRVFVKYHMNGKKYGAKADQRG